MLHLLWLMIDYQINMRIIRLLPSNNPDSTSLLESSLHKNIYVSLSLVLPPSLSLAPLPSDECDITWRGSMCSMGVLFIYPHVPSPPLIFPLLSLLKTMEGCRGFVFDPDKSQNTRFMPGKTVWECACVRESRIVHPCIHF